MKPGFVTEQETSKVFLKVKYDSICEVYDQPGEGLTPHTVSNPQTGQPVTKYIRPYPAVVAYVTGIEWYKREDSNTGKKYVGYNLLLDVGGQAAVLDLAYGKIGYKTFVRCAENVDWSQPVKFSAWKDRKKQNAMGFCLAQDDGPIKWKFTRDNPNGCPPPKESRGVDGGVTWDWREQEIWLKERVDSVVVPAIQAAQAAREKMSAKPKDELEGAYQHAQRKAAAAGAGEPPDWPEADPDDSVPF